MNKIKLIFLFLLSFLSINCSVTAQIEIELESIANDVGEVKLICSKSKIKIFNNFENVIEKSISFDPQYIKRKKMEFNIYYFVDSLGVLKEYEDKNLKLLTKDSDTIFVQKLPNNISDQSNFLLVKYGQEVYLINIRSTEYLFNFNAQIIYALKSIKFTFGEEKYSLYQLMNQSLGFIYGQTF